MNPVLVALDSLSLKDESDSPPVTLDDAGPNVYIPLDDGYEFKKPAYPYGESMDVPTYVTRRVHDVVRVELGDEEFKRYAGMRVPFNVIKRAARSMDASYDWMNSSEMIKHFTFRISNCGTMMEAWMGKIPMISTKSDEPVYRYEFLSSAGSSRYLDVLSWCDLTPRDGYTLVDASRNAANNGHFYFTIAAFAERCHSESKYNHDMCVGGIVQLCCIWETKGGDLLCSYTDRLLVKKNLGPFVAKGDGKLRVYYIPFRLVDKNSVCRLMDAISYASGSFPFALAFDAIAPIRAIVYMRKYPSVPSMMPKSLKPAMGV